MISSRVSSPCSSWSEMLIREVSSHFPCSQSIVSPGARASCSRAAAAVRILKVEPGYDPFRSDACFQDVLRRMSFPE